VKKEKALSSGEFIGIESERPLTLNLLLRRLTLGTPSPVGRWGELLFGARPNKGGLFPQTPRRGIIKIGKTNREVL